MTKMSHALQLNIDVLSLLSEETMRRSIIEGEKSAQRYQQFQQAVRMCLTEQSFFKKHVDLLQTFADRRSLQVGPLSFCCRLFFKRELTWLAKLRDAIALQDSNIMMGMNKITTQETTTMRTLTLIAMIYLPASFTAVRFPSQSSTREYSKMTESRRL